MLYFCSVVKQGCEMSSEFITAGMQDTVCQVRMLASGSAGNAIYVRLEEVRLLIDVGISRRRIVNALKEIGEDLSSIDAILLTHEHVDHVCALRKIRQKRPDISIYSTAGTALACLRRKRWRYRHDVVEADRSFAIGPLQITPFAISHDAYEPVGYRIEVDDFAVGIATDLGRYSASVQRSLRDCQVLVVEANHDPEMLFNGPYPAHLKRRVFSDKGHLSNEQARDLLTSVAGPKLKQVILGHLSEKNNCPDLALAVVKEGFAGTDVKVRVAERKTPGPLMTFLRSCEDEVPVPALMPSAPASEQMSLF